MNHTVQFHAKLLPNKILVPKCPHNLMGKQATLKHINVKIIDKQLFVLANSIWTFTLYMNVFT